MSAHLSVGRDGARRDFVVVWESYGSRPERQQRVQHPGARFASNGSALGAQFQVNTYTTGFQRVRRWRVAEDGVRRGLVGETDRRLGHQLVRRPGQRYASDGSRKARSSRSTPTRRPTSGVHRSPQMPMGTSSWCGPATARSERTRAATASRASATPRTGRLSAGSSRSTATRRATRRSFAFFRDGRRRRRLRRGLEQPVVRDGHCGLQLQGPALCLEWNSTGIASSRSTPIRPAGNSGRSPRRMTTETSSSPGTARARPGRTTTATACRASASRRTDRRKAHSSR